MGYEARKTEHSGPVMKGRSAVSLRKKAKRGFRDYPIGTVAFYGPTADFATKLVASIVPGDGCAPDPLDW